RARPAPRPTPDAPPVISTDFPATLAAMTSSPALGCGAHEPVREVAARRATSLVLALVRGEAIDLRVFRDGFQIEPVEPGSIARQDRVLRRAVGGAERREAVLLLHVRGDLDPPE